MRDMAIGVFDSGIGGLSVLRHVRALLPAERLIYVADNRHAPYGDREAAWVEGRCLELAGFFQDQGAKALLVACNTATAVSVERLRARLSMPVVGIEPAIKPAVEAADGGVVGVMTTRATAESPRFRALCARFADRARILVRACPGLVECVEAGDFDSPRTHALLEEHLHPLRRAGASVIVLGCTHYPFLIEAIRARANGARIIEPGLAVARQLVRRLREEGLLCGGEAAGETCFYSSDPARAPDAPGLWPEGLRWRALPHPD
ncbi:MAG: glutamate racemase [Mariprofundaceae bacterium]